MVGNIKHVSGTKGETLTSLLMLCKRWNGDGCSVQGSVPNGVSLYPKLNRERFR